MSKILPLALCSPYSSLLKSTLLDSMNTMLVFIRPNLCSVKVLPHTTRMQSRNNSMYASNELCVTPERSFISR